MEWWWMQVSVHVYENREGMFEAHLVHSWRGGTETSRAEMQTQISGGAINEGRRESVSIKGILTLPPPDELVAFSRVFSLHLEWRAKASLDLLCFTRHKTHFKPERSSWSILFLFSPRFFVWGETWDTEKVFPQPKPNIPSVRFKAHRKLNSTGNFYPIIIFSFLSVIRTFPYTNSDKSCSLNVAVTNISGLYQTFTSDISFFLIKHVSRFGIKGFSNSFLNRSSCPPRSRNILCTQGMKSVLNYSEKVKANLVSGFKL